jgi:hypothetical protein
VRHVPDATLVAGGSIPADRVRIGHLIDLTQVYGAMAGYRPTQTLLMGPHHASHGNDATL